ncbi:MAG: selenium-binding protein SBP56-related protein [Gemmatimonadota bacterium]
MSCGATDDAASLGDADAPATPSPYLYLWAGDADAAEGDSDFLAVVDADPESPTYGSVLGTAPVGSAGNDPHHAEPIAPSDGPLFVNGFSANRTFLFDLSSRGEPAFVRELQKVPGFEYPHSFYRLENSHVLATFQRGDGSRPGDTGGLAEFDADGALVRVTSAADPDFEGRMIRPYAIEVFPEVDRVLTTSNAMPLIDPETGGFIFERAENVLQLWRLSDLSLLVTLTLPPLPPAEEPECFIEDLMTGKDCTPSRIAGHNRPFEIRTLLDGSAILNTFACGIYRIHAIDTDEPRVDMLMNWPEKAGCSVPTMVGKFEVLPIMLANEIVTLDVSDPTSPVEVARLTFDEAFMPHWAQVDPDTYRIAVTGIGADTGQVFMYWVDPDTGELTPDEAFGQVDGLGKGFSMTRDEWPHGPTGPAVPHAALFGR